MVSKVCAVCPTVIVRNFASELARIRTCGRRCGGQLQREEKAARRLQQLTTKGLNAMSPVEAYRWGYKCGYQRRVDFEKQRQANP